MAGVGTDGTLSLADARLVRRLRSGETAAFQALWAAWRDRCWSVLRPMAASREEAVGLLRAVYLGLPQAVRSWPTDTALCCLVGGHVFRVARCELELPPITGIDAPVPLALSAPDREGVARRVAAMPANVRLTYLVDLIFGCPAATTAALVGEDEHQLRLARAQGAWSIVAPAGGEG